LAGVEELVTEAWAVADALKNRVHIAGVPHVAETYKAAA
jgi:hypothetical protein